MRCIKCQAEIAGTSTDPCVWTSTGRYHYRCFTDHPKAFEAQQYLNDGFTKAETTTALQLTPQDAKRIFG